MKFKGYYNLILFILILGLTACNKPTEKVFDEQLAGKLQTVLDDAVKNPDTKFPGALLCVSSPEMGNWAGAAGLSNIDKTISMKPDDRFRAASILKTFVSVVTLQLIEEKKLSLDDLMTKVLPNNVTSKISGSDKITTRMLLNHTSGIPDWLTNEIMGKIAANPQNIWTIDEYLDVVAAQKPYFPPGEGWRYSNTDYNLLGMIIERITNRSWREEIRKRIIKPLKLANTRLPEPGDLSISDNHARGYVDMGGNQLDFTKIDSSMAGAAGGHAIITTTKDLTLFLNAVMTGGLFKNSKTLDEMLTFIEVPDNMAISKYKASYGLGIVKILVPGNIEMIGHSGTTGGFQSFVYYFPIKELTISGLMNNTSSNDYQIISPAIELLLTESSKQK